jgi:hypothetical protein
MCSQVTNLWLLLRRTCSFAVAYTAVSATEVEQRTEFAKKDKWASAVLAESLFELTHVLIVPQRFLNVNRK